MRVVADASVLIDLVVGQVVVQAADLEFDWLAADTILNELDQEANTVSVILEITAFDLPFEQLEIANALATENRALSMPDCHALVLSHSQEAMLLTGDGILRQVAKKRGVEVHGTLWLLDLMVDRRLLTPQRAILALANMRQAGSRFPNDECEERIRIWRSP